MAKDEYQELLELRKKVKEQEEKIEKLNSQVENLTQAVLHKNKKLFGASTEKTPVEGQISLFNEAEDLADSAAIEPTPDNIIVSTHKRIPRKKGSKEAVIKDLPRQTVECVLEGEDSLCGLWLVQGLDGQVLNYDKLERIKVLCNELDKSRTESYINKANSINKSYSDLIREFIINEMNNARARGENSITFVSGEINKALNFKPHKNPQISKIMWELKGDGDEVLYTNIPRPLR